jgi:hypothetical protein
VKLSGDGAGLRSIVKTHPTLKIVSGGRNGVNCLSALIIFSLLRVERINLRGPAGQVAWLSTPGEGEEAGRGRGGEVQLTLTTR